MICRLSSWGKEGGFSSVAKKEEKRLVRQLIGRLESFGGKVWPTREVGNNHGGQLGTVHRYISQNLIRRICL